jgi:hypothetical protein
MVSCSGSVVVKLVPTLNTTFYPGFCNIIHELGCFLNQHILGCFFHFTQCIWGKAQACGLAVQNRQDSQTQKLVRRAAVIPLVPAQQVDNVWLNALVDNDDNSIQTTKFKDYEK